MRTKFPNMSFLLNENFEPKMSEISKLKYTTIIIVN